MKRRIRKMVNFFAFNLLFFALYLNFIHKDKMVTPTATEQPPILQQTAAFSGTVLVENPEQYLEKKEASTVSVDLPKPSGSRERIASNEPLKLSIN